jgi:hypothetical protein
MGDKLLALVKFGKEEHIRSLVDKGEVYLNSIDYFKNSTHKEIGDKLEGASFIVNMENFKMKIEHPILDKPLLLKGITGQIANFSGDYTHCFSIYAVSGKLFEGKNSHKIDVRMQEFGTHCAVIEKPHDFLGRILDAVKNFTGTYAWNFISYHDFSTLGEHKPSHFDKKQEFSHQSEYRILARLNADEPLTLNIGNIADYCKVWETSKLLEADWIVERGEVN